MEDLKYPSGAPMYITETKAKDPTDAVFGITPDSEVIHKAISSAPHILVAGTTGSGKSVTLNNLLITMMLHATPKQLQVAMVDPKQVEFSLYENNPYVLTNPITDMDAASDFFIYLTLMMDNRYSELTKHGVKNIGEFNKKALKEGFDTWPYVVVIVDEFADLIMQNKDVEDPIIRLAQKARAAGIHMILATQTPRVNVVTGMIKANFPTRVAHMVANSTESSIILDENGAEQLSPYGDMFIKWGGAEKVRAQAPFISTDEIKAIIDKQMEIYPAPELTDWQSQVDEYNEERQKKEQAKRDARFGRAGAGAGARSRSASDRSPATRIAQDKKKAMENNPAKGTAEDKKRKKEELFKQRERQVSQHFKIKQSDFSSEMGSAKTDEVHTVSAKEAEEKVETPTSAPIDNKIQPIKPTRERTASVPDEQVDVSATDYHDGGYRNDDNHNVSDYDIPTDTGSDSDLSVSSDLGGLFGSFENVEER